MNMRHKNFFNFCSILSHENSFKKEKFKSFAKSLLPLAGFFACMFPFVIDAMESHEGDENFSREFLSQGAAAAGPGPALSYMTRSFQDDSASRLLEASRTFQQSSSLLERHQEPALLHDLGASFGNSFLHTSASESLLSQHSFRASVLHDLGEMRLTPFSRRPPTPDPLKKYRLKLAQINEILGSGNFQRGNILSFLENARSYWDFNFTYDIFRPLDLSPILYTIRTIPLEIYLNGEVGVGNGIEVAVRAPHHRPDDEEQRARAPHHRPDDEEQRARAPHHRPDDEEQRARAIAEARNLENVMNAERMAKTKVSIGLIYSLLQGKKINEEVCIQEFRLYLEHLQKGTRHASFARRNGMNEVDNAFYTLERSGHLEDHDSILRGDAQIYIHLEDGTPVTIKSLLAKTWWLINWQFKDKQQDVLKESLVRAIGQCIEDDGHRVCNVGKSQRITTVLQGYIEGIKTDDIEIAPEPNTFLSSFFAPKQEEIISVLEKTPDEKRLYAGQLLEEMRKAAEMVYKDAPQKIAEVMEKANDFIRLSLEV